jgi:hypothetical protein
VKLVRLLLAVIAILFGGAIMGWVAAEITGMPDIFGILQWEVLFIAIAGALAYSAVKCK